MVLADKPRAPDGCCGAVMGARGAEESVQSKGQLLAHEVLSGDRDFSRGPAFANLTRRWDDHTLDRRERLVQGLRQIDSSDCGMLVAGPWGAGLEGGVRMKKRMALTLALSGLFALASGSQMFDSASAQEEAAAGFSVTELVLSKSIENHDPVDPGTTFSRADGRIYATVRIANPDRTATSIRVAWERVGDPANHGGVTLEIPARVHYRVVARTGTQRAAGRYRCVVYNAEDEEISATEFELTE